MQYNALAALFYLPAPDNANTLLFMVLVRYLLICSFSLLLFPLLAQEPTQPMRLELPFDIDKTEAEVIALPDSSLLVYHKTSDLWGTDATFNFTKYNAQLEPVWADTIAIAPDNEFIRYYESAPYLYLVLGQDDLLHYTFVRLNQATGQMQRKRYKLDQLDAIYEFMVLQGNYFIVGHGVKESKPVLLHLNTRTDEVQLLPAVYGEQSTFSDLLADPARQRVDAVLSESNGRISRLQVKSYDANGNLRNSQFILQQEKRSLLHAEVTPGDSSQEMLFGTYGTRDLRYNQGFFTTPVTSAVVDEEGRFYSMLDLKNFFKFLKPRQEERTRRKETTRQKQGKNPGYRYRLLLHDLIPTPTGYILAAEVYYPQYSNSSGNWGIDRAISMGRMQELYKRTHAVALGFDKEGVLLWDNAFPLKDVATYQLVHTVEVGYLPDGRVVMAYPDDSKIIYKVMDHSKFSDEETETEILTYEESEKIQETISPGIIRWYGNNFAAFGFQRIRSGNSGPRTVFYINKVSF